MAYTYRGFFLDASSEGGEDVKTISILMMTMTFVLGFGFLSFMFVLGKMLLAGSKE